MGKFFEALKKWDDSDGNAKPAVIDVSDGALGKEEAGDRQTVNDNVLDPLSPLDELPSEPQYKKTDRSESLDRFKTKSQGLPRPSAKRSLNKNLVVYHDPQSFEAEQFRMLRTNILFPSDGKRSPRIILVTSALPEEGKSFVSSNLALTIAQNIDNHVLLIDCDMRHPSVHSNFGYDQVPGLSNYLEGEYTLSDVLLKIEGNHLSLLPGGPPPPNPAELLSSNRMLSLLREVRARYDDRYIIIDSPPPHLTAESKALAQFVDGIVLVVKFGHTKRDLVSQLVDKLPKDKILGVVANWLDRRAATSYVSGKYSQYTNYYSSKKR